jgi:hypothetical protein
MERLDYLRRLHTKYIGWNDLRDSITIKLGSEFEPFGRATEDWDDIYKLEMQYVPYRWKTAQGTYRAGASGLYMCFEDETLEKVIEKAINYLEDYYGH